MCQPWCVRRTVHLHNTHIQCVHVFQMLWSIVLFNCFDYLSQMTKHCGKFKVVFERGMNYKDTDYGTQPLSQLLKCKHRSKEWLSLLFEASIKSGTAIDEDTLQIAEKECENEEWKGLMQNYKTQMSLVKLSM